MKQFKMVILLITTCIALSCCPEKGTPYLIFVNNSERKIVCQEIWSGSISDADTLFQCRTGARGIASNSSYNFSSLNHSGWETDFKVIPYLRFLIMDADMYEKYIEEPCDTIRKYVPILNRYQLKLEDLQRMNWTVVYPPEK